MKKTVFSDLEKYELNKILEEKYGFDYWNFADSFFDIYCLYKFRDNTELNKLLSARIDRIEQTKTKSIELLDGLLCEIRFYKYSKYHSSISDFNYKWTSNNRKSFIVEKFHLKALFQALDEMVSIYLDDCHLSFEPKNKIYLKPLNFLILVWSYAFKKENRVDWKNLSALLHWFVPHLIKYDISDLFVSKKEDIPSPERMRFIYNKYKGTRHDSLAYSYFIGCFRDQNFITWKKEQSFISTNAEYIDYSDPLKYLYEWLWCEKKPSGYLGLIDLLVAYSLL